MLRTAVQLMALAAIASAASSGALAARKSDSPAVVLSEFINEHAPYPQCHASTIAQTTSGNLVAAWFGGTREGNPDVGIWFARLVHGHWLPAIEVATGVQSDGTRYPTWNPVLFQAPKGPLFLFYKVGPKPSMWWGMVMTSINGGLTWSKPRRLSDSILGPIKDKPVVLADGNWLAGSSSENLPAGWRVHFELSSSRGRTWKFIGPVGRGPGFEAIQPTILFPGHGKIEALCRTKQGVIAMTWSSDGGRTWSPLAATTLPNPNSGIDAVTLRDGVLLLVYNNSGNMPGRSKGYRYPLDVAISRDGLKWQHVLTLESKPMPDGYAYPAVIQTRDGLVHITYTWDRKMIKYVVIDPRKLETTPTARHGLLKKAIVARPR